MFTSRDLKATITEVRPIVERQLDDAALIASFRETVTAKGGDWSQVKALVKAMIQDERDEAGGHKRVLAILHKADNALGYADMLGLGNLNEKNSFEPEHDADGVIIEHSSRAKAAHAVSREEDADERQHSSNSGMAGADEPGRQTSASADADPASYPRASRNGVDGTSEGQGATGAGTEGASPSTGSTNIEPAPLITGVAAVGGGSVNHPVASAAVTIHEPATIPTAVPLPAEVAVAAGRNSATLPAAVPAGDRTKPHPWCLDQEECGLSSWEHLCLRCQRVQTERRADGVSVQ